jgi:hypothetical protein
VRGLGDRAPRFIHECAGQQQERTFAADRSFACDALKASAPRSDAVALGDLLKRHEANIVPVADITLSRISKSDQEQHQRHPALEHDPEKVETGFPKKIMRNQNTRAPIDSN